MAVRLTLHLPDHVAAQLRERSRANGLSLIEVTVRALERGLAQDDDAPEDEWWQGMGGLIERPPLKKFNPEEFDRLIRQVHISREQAQGLMDELDWVRSDATGL